MIHKKYQFIISSFFMALFMSVVISFVFCVIDIGITSGLLFTWLKKTGVSFVIAFPTAVIMSPIVQKIVSLVITKPVHH